MLSVLLLFVYFYSADGNHYLIETSDNSEEAVSAGMDYAEPGCIELPTRFSVSCVREGCIKFSFFCSF